MYKPTTHNRTNLEISSWATNFPKLLKEYAKRCRDSYQLMLKL
ncbi:hypothetical protein [Arenibacter latericius]|nr:hypothetical protein [Arenibacter latericius]MDX1363823.1 hypothetical protein [Arenibacter latericius]